MSKAWASGSTTAWRRLRALVLARDGYRCQLRRPGCTGTATQACHVVARSRGGRDVADNLVAGCQHCNGSEGAGPEDPKAVIRTAW